MDECANHFYSLWYYSLACGFQIAFFLQAILVGKMILKPRRTTLIANYKSAPLLGQGPYFVDAIVSSQIFHQTCLYFGHIEMEYLLNKKTMEKICPLAESNNRPRHCQLGRSALAGGTSDALYRWAKRADDLQCRYERYQQTLIEWLIKSKACPLAESNNRPRHYPIGCSALAGGTSDALYRWAKRAAHTIPK